MSDYVPTLNSKWKWAVCESGRFPVPWVRFQIVVTQLLFYCVVNFQFILNTAKKDMFQSCTMCEDPLFYCSLHKANTEGVVR